MYKNGFSINNLQWVLSHKTEPNQMFQIPIWILQTIQLFVNYIGLQILIPNPKPLKSTICMARCAKESNIPAPPLLFKRI